MRVSLFHSFIFIFVILFSFAFSEDITTPFVLNQLPPTVFDVKQYTFRATEQFNSFGGDIEISEETKCSTTLKDSDGDVFFEVRKDKRFCIIHSFVKANERSARVYAMQGTFCNISGDGQDEFSIFSIDNELANCRWNGNECAEDAEGLKVNFHLEGKGFSLTDRIDSPWAITGGRVIIDNPTNGYTILTQYKGFIFFNVTNQDGSSWCIVSSEAHLRDYHPMSMVYQAHNALCNTKELAYHQFRITAEKVEGAFCLFDGLQCRIETEILQPKLINANQ
jgi:hypothetical protein